MSQSDAAGEKQPLDLLILAFTKGLWKEVVWLTHSVPQAEETAYDPYDYGVEVVVKNYLATFQNSLKFIEQNLIKPLLEQWFAWYKGCILNFKPREASCWPGHFGDCQEFLPLAKGGIFAVLQESCKIHSPEGRSFRWVNKTQLIIFIILGYLPPLLCKVWETPEPPLVYPSTSQALTLYPRLQSQLLFLIAGGKMKSLGAQGTPPELHLNRCPAPWVQFRFTTSPTVPWGHPLWAHQLCVMLWGHTLGFFRHWAFSCVFLLFWL